MRLAVVVLLALGFFGSSSSAVLAQSQCDTVQVTEMIATLAGESLKNAVAQGKLTKEQAVESASQLETDKAVQDDFIFGFRKGNGNCSEEQLRAMIPDIVAGAKAALN